MKRTFRAELAQETLNILQRGSYLCAEGTSIQLDDLQIDAVAQTTIHTPAGLEAKLAAVLDSPLRGVAAALEVTGETTLEAARRLVVEEGCGDVVALNFASARNPGGGFLKGSQAQEESLARSSGLYPCLLTQQTYYSVHRRQPSGFYTDHMIHSPGVPVIRSDAGDLLEAPYLLSFITSPAVNAGVVRSKRKQKTSQIPTVMTERTAKVLALAVSKGHETIILGAWGCGVFRNEPATIASIFREVLFGEMRFIERFKRVVFAVFDPGKKQTTRGAFDAEFRDVI